jgi:hypothetical protein
MKHKGYQKRNYRDWINPEDLKCFVAVEQETDLAIYAKKDLLKKALKSIKKHRDSLIQTIRLYPEFESSLIPVEIKTPVGNIARDMLIAGQKASVGPFAAVAGAMAEYTGKDLLKYTDEIIIENGGDIFITTKKDRIIAIFAGGSPFTGRIGILFKKELSPAGICTSSGTVGHSKSFGKADAVVVVSKSTPLADAVATSACNKIQTKDDIKKALEYAMAIEGIEGIIVIIDGHIGVQGGIELTST